MGSVVLASQLAAGLGVLAGAALIKFVIQDDEFWRGGGGVPRCATCGGTGRVACLCNRWSDGDSGCRSCAGSGRMACRSCGGTGTGRPLPVRLATVQNRNPPTCGMRMKTMMIKGKDGPRRLIR